MPRRLAVACLAVLSASVISACGSSDLVAHDPKPAGDPTAASVLPDDIAKAGTLRVMTDPTYPPLEYVDESGKMVGSDVDLMEAIGRELGLKVEWTRGSFSGIIPGLKADRFDASIAGMYISNDKFTSVTMVQYANAFDQILVPSDYDGPELNSYEALCGKSLTIPTGSTEIPQIEAASADCEAAGSQGIDLQTFDSANNALLAVTSGRAETALVSNLNAEYVIDKLNADLKVHGNLPGTFPMGVTLQRDDEQLADAMSNALNALKESGEYNEIMTKWNLSASEVDEFLVNPDVTFSQG